MQRLRKVAVLFIALLMLTACATVGPTATGQALTAKQQATVWLSDYNSISANVKAVASSPISTPAQLDMARKELVIMKQVYPLLRTYDSLVNSGGTPSPQDVQTITNLMTQLATMIGGK